MNIIILIITMLDCLEVNMEVLGASIKTIRSNNCRKISEDNKNAIGVLAIM